MEFSSPLIKRPEGPPASNQLRLAVHNDQFEPTQIVIDDLAREQNGFSQRAKPLGVKITIPELARLQRLRLDP